MKKQSVKSESKNFFPSQPKVNLEDQVDQWFKKNRSLKLRQTPFWAQSTAALAISLSTMAVAAGFLFRIDEVVTARGQLKAVGGTVEIKSSIDGKVKNVFFEESDFVKKGDLLIELDTTNSLTQISLVQTKIDAEKESYNNTLEIIEKRQKTLELNKAVLESKVSTKKEILSNLSVLVQNGGYQRIQFLQSKDDLLETQARLQNTLEEISQLQLQKTNFIVESRKTMQELKSELDILTFNIANQKIYSPSTGIILNPSVRTDLPVYRGESLVSVVPIEKVYAEVQISNQDIGFIKLNQDARIRVDAYPFASFGEIPGTVYYIAADAKQTNDSLTYPVKLKLHKDQNDKFKSLKLVPGMSIQSNMKLRDKPVIAIVSDLFTRQVDSVKSIRSER